MKPLCEKIYIDKIAEIVLAVLSIPLYVILVINRIDHLLWWIFIIMYTAFLIWLISDIIYWALQPKVLIYQYDMGIVINRKEKIEYTSIKRVYFKNYIHKRRIGNFYKDIYSGIIYIELKSGETRKVRNAFYPLDAVDVLSKIKQQKKFR